MCCNPCSDPAIGGGGAGCCSLADTLLVGNVSGASPIIMQGGQPLRADGADPLNLRAQLGGISVRSEDGDPAGSIEVIAGDGPAALSGNGGTVLVQAGDSGTTGGTPGSVVVEAGAAATTADGGWIEVRAGDSVDGNGGNVQITAGGSSSQQGGDLELIGGQGPQRGDVIVRGANAGVSPGTGGNVSMRGGDGGALFGPGGDAELIGGEAFAAGEQGGSISVEAGDGDVAGEVSIVGGSSPNGGGLVVIEGGLSTTAAGGTGVLRGGNGDSGGGLVAHAGSGNAGPGGAAELHGGASLAGNGGAVSVRGGQGAVVAGSVAVEGGNGLVAGNVAIAGGQSTGAPGGSVSMRGGSSNANGGSALVAGGDQPLAGGIGGSATVRGGDAAMVGGSLSLAGGDAGAFGGFASLRGGDVLGGAGTPGGASVTGGSNISPGQNGATAQLTGGQGDGAGGDAIVLGGQGVSTAGGLARVIGGDGGLSGGSVEISAGQVGLGGSGGNVLIEASDGDLAGGAVDIIAGHGDATGLGGSVNVFAGDGANGADVSLEAGAGLGVAGNGGDIVARVGAGVLAAGRFLIDVVTTIFHWPTVDGTARQPMVTDGSGVLGFVTLDSSDIANASSVPGANVTEALDELINAAIARNWSAIVSNNTTGLNSMGMAGTATGTGTQHTLAVGNVYSEMSPLTEYLQASASNVFARVQSTGTVLLADGGYDIRFLGGLADGSANASTQMAFGMAAAGAVNTGAPSASANSLLFGFDAADTNIQLMHNDGAGSATKVDTGLARPSGDRDELYYCRFVNVAGSGEVTCTILRISDMATFAAVVNSDQPAAGTGLVAFQTMNNGGATAPVGLGFGFIKRQYPTALVLD